jgi:hypothetical protein
MAYELITDLIDGRREIIGWARKGQMTEWEGVQVPEWAALTMQRDTEGRPVCIDCGDYGWLPKTEDDLLLFGAPHCVRITRQLVPWQERVTQEILDAAERYRNTVQRN